jgi:hypothetical protein
MESHDSTRAPGIAQSVILIVLGLREEPSAAPLRMRGPHGIHECEMKNGDDHKATIAEETHRSCW